MQPIIEIQDLAKCFRRTVAVDGLSLAAPAGRVTAFLGPNGAGKTTTIKCLLNLHAPDAGSVRVLGCDSRRLGPREFQQVGYVSENQELPLWMTVRQFMDYCRPLYPTWDEAFARQLTDDFELPRDTRLKALSRGMRMKAALLSSLAYRPRLVVLDEPFSGLDPLVRDEFIRGLLELTEEEGWSVFISSHDIEEVERLADQVAIIDRGKLRLDESAESLQARFRDVEVVVDGEPPELTALPATWLNAELSGRVVRFVDAAYDAERLGAEVRARLPGARGPVANPMTLRQIFVALARSHRLNGLAPAREE
ncbi:MAG: ABC transporter ATP-binding protein [Verrucomicrobiales bacterium]|nr:ABC transporter ATP-binding protein [Verrucomicrobiales bacterium]MCP5527812.1 ABC transporter ATP-binding protein [Verrucomicrobiales bacterium]